MIVDWYTKYSLFLPTTIIINAVELAEVFYQEVELRFGAPEGVISDRGAVFTS